MATLPAATDETKHGVLGTLAVVALTLVLAYQLAHWTWVFVAPQPVAAIPEGDPPVNLAEVAKLFGGEMPAPQGTASRGGLRLKGVVAPTPGTVASAIFSTGAGKDVAVLLGREVQKGVKLAEVHPDHVVLARGAARERVDLEALRAAAPQASRTGRVSGFRINVARTGANNYTFSRRELEDALRDPYQLNHLGQIGMPPTGGARLDAAPAGSLAQKLGLQPGDVIKKVNGQSVASPGDLARIYQQFGSLSLIQAEVQRGTATVQLSYAIQP